MRFLKGALPNISLVLTVALMVVIYLDRRNPMMGFLVGAPFFILALMTGIASIATSVVLYSDWRKSKKQKRKAEKMSNDT